MERESTNEDLADQVRGQTVPTRVRRDRPAAARTRWRCAGRTATPGGDWTWADYAERATRLAASLRGLGVGRGDRVVLMMRNRPEFHVADVAVLLLGATPISIYNSSAPEQVQYLVGHCEASVAILEDERLPRAASSRSAPTLPKLRELIVIERARRRAARRRARLGRPDRRPTRSISRSRAKTAQPSDIATVIYTSGTTGPPKGVVLDHENICWTIECLRLCLRGHRGPRVAGSSRTCRWRTSPSG